MTRYLLDTHVWLWSLFETKLIPPKVLHSLEDTENEIYISAASLWEVSIKHAKGILRMPLTPAACYDRSIENNKRLPLSVSPRHALATAHLERHHGDPFDRLLVAQALEEGMVLVTHDPKMQPYPCRVLMI